MEKQKVLSIIIVVLILIFSAFTVLLFTLNLSTNSAVKIDATNSLASEPMIIRPSEASISVKDVIPEPAIMPTETDALVAENNATSQIQGEKVLKSTPGKLQRTTHHVSHVKAGDSVSAITLSQWGNAYLWPDLYTYNSWRSDNPDLIYPGERVEIPNHLGRNHRYSDDEIASLTTSYLEVYNLYRKEGAKANSSKWYTLYSATRIIPDFLDKNREHINADDIIMAQKHMKESTRLE